MKQNNPKPEDFLKRFAPPQENYYSSLGNTCRILGITPGQLYALMHAAEVSFDEMRDGVLYFGAASLEKVLDQYNRVNAEVQAVRASAANN